MPHPSPSPLAFCRNLPRGICVAAVLVFVGQPVESGAQRVSERSAQRRPAYDEWTTYLNPRFAYQVPVPPGLRAQTDPNKGGNCRFISDDGLFVLKTWGSSRADEAGNPLEFAWRQALTQRGRRVEFQRRSRTGFVLTGENGDGTDFYEKVILGPAATAGTNISFPPALGIRYEAWMDEIERGLTWHNGGRMMVRDEDPPQRGIFGDLRHYFTGEDDRESLPWREPIPDARDRDPLPPDDAPGPPVLRRSPNETEVDLTPPPAKRRENPATVPWERPAIPPAIAPNLKPPPTKREDLPYGIAIPGKKGFVYSPFAENKQQVDVTDIPTGTKVKCPYTSKVFRVP